MIFRTRYFNNCIELTVVGSHNIEFTEDITDLYGVVDEYLIDELKSLIDELIHHNKSIKENNNET